MPDIKDRLLIYLKESNITQKNFSEITGISLWNITGKSNQSELGGAQISEILGKFHNLSPDWLLLGRGEMLRKNERKSVSVSDSPQATVSNGDMKTRYATLTPSLVEMLQGVMERFSYPGTSCHPSKEGRGGSRPKDRGELYLFGFNEELAPGERAVNKSYFQKSWERMRKATGLPKEMQLYSLRDTGITDLLHAGIDPLTVRHHVDHSSQAIQDIYTDHYDEGVNEKIFNSGVRF